MRLRIRLLSAAAVLPLALTACTSGSDAGKSGSAAEIRYAMWDSNQLPAYQECKEVFERKNPDIRIKIEQTIWDDYWSKLNTQLITESAPDVFTNHVSKYGLFARKGLIEPIDALVERDTVDTGAYFPGLAEQWQGPDGTRYGLPKDWDTIALFYNKKMARAAGISEADMANLTWNPKDGGSYEKIIAKLTIDRNGVRGDEPGFDPENVKTYGIGYDDSGANTHGQTQWSYLAVANGFSHTNKSPWGTKYHYDDPKFIESMSWYRGLIKKGYAPPLAMAEGGVGASDQFGGGNYAMVPHGNWMIPAFLGFKDLDTGIAPLPVGPSGKRASMFNGLADAIWSGSKHKEAAWQWVKFMGSEECQKIVGSYSVVFPALPSGTEVAMAEFEKKGIDVTPFTQYIDEKTTFPFPVTDHAPEITAILEPAMDEVLTTPDPAPVLRRTNREINALFR